MHLEIPEFLKFYLFSQNQNFIQKLLAKKIPTTLTLNLKSLYACYFNNILNYLHSKTIFIASRVSSPSTVIDFLLMEFLEWESSTKENVLIAIAIVLVLKLWLLLLNAYRLYFQKGCWTGKICLILFTNLVWILIINSPTLWPVKMMK